MSAASVSPDTYRVHAWKAAPGISIGNAKTTEIQLDTSRLGGDTVPGPAELLCLALAGCLLKNVERFAHLLSFEYEGAAVSVSAERQDAPPRFTRFRYELRIRTNEDDHRVELLHRNLRRFGTVYNTLGTACDVDGILVAGPDATDPSEGPPSPAALPGRRCC